MCSFYYYLTEPCRIIHSKFYTFDAIHAAFVVILFIVLCLCALVLHMFAGQLFLWCACTAKWSHTEWTIIKWVLQHCWTCRVWVFIRCRQSIIHFSSVYLLYFIQISILCVQVNMIVLLVYTRFLCKQCDKCNDVYVHTIYVE